MKILARIVRAFRAVDRSWSSMMQAVISHALRPLDRVRVLTDVAPLLQPIMPLYLYRRSEQLQKRIEEDSVSADDVLSWEQVKLPHLPSSR